MTQKLWVNLSLEGEGARCMTSELWVNRSLLGEGPDQTTSTINSALSSSAEYTRGERGLS